jgi:hypothetical protein
MEALCLRLPVVTRERQVGRVVVAKVLFRDDVLDVKTGKRKSGLR